MGIGRGRFARLSCRISTVFGRARVDDLVNLDHVAIGIVEEDLVPAFHCVAAPVGIGYALILKMLFERRDIIGAIGDMAPFKRVNRVARAERVEHIAGCQVHLDVAISHKRHIPDQAFAVIDRRQVVGVIIAERQDIAIESVHRGHVCRTQVDVVEFELHAQIVRQSARKGNQDAFIRST